MSGIQIKYTPLLQLSIEQLFYENHICRQYQSVPELDIVVTPTNSCLDVMKRMDLIFKNTDNTGGFIVLARIAADNTVSNVLRFAPRKEDALSFLLVLRNPDVGNFNDLPAQPAEDKIYYFSNEVADAAAPRNNLHLTKNATGVSGADDVIKKSSENYRFHHSSVVIPGTALVKHLMSGQTAAPVSITTDGGQSDLVFNLSTLPAGKFELLISNFPVDEFYYLREHYNDPVFAVIELSLSPTLASNYRLVEPDRSLTPDRPQYTIQFVNRQTTWRYTVQLQTNSPLFLEMAELTPAEKTAFINQLNIESNDTGITFTRASATDTEFVFVSDNPILLHEKYFSATSVSHERLILTLKKYIGDPAKEAAVRTNLPYPSTGSIDALTPPQIYSDVFLTL